MNAGRIVTAVAVMTLLLGGRASAQSQDDREGPAITARVHATFIDAIGGGGVLSGDLTIVRFEVRNGTVTAIGRIAGALADSLGNVLGRVDEELALAAGNMGSTCNQLQIDLDAVDADILGARVHFDRGAAGFDSRQGTTPKALPELCAVGDMLRGPSTPAARANALNVVAAAVKARNPR
jgi:hypothetical protein